MFSVFCFDSCLFHFLLCIFFLLPLFLFVAVNMKYKWNEVNPNSKMKENSSFQRKKSLMGFEAFCAFWINTLRADMCLLLFPQCLHICYEKKRIHWDESRAFLATWLKKFLLLIFILPNRVRLMEKWWCDAGLWMYIRPIVCYRWLSQFWIILKLHWGSLEI